MASPISADGSRLYYCPLMSRKLYSVSVDALLDKSKSDTQVGETVTDEGDKGGIADGLYTDTEGRVYVTSPEHNAILRRAADGYYETVVHDSRLLWPDTLHLAEDGYLYVTCNQLHRQARYHEGRGSASEAIWPVPSARRRAARAVGVTESQRHGARQR